MYVRHDETAFFLTALGKGINYDSKRLLLMFPGQKANES